MKTPILLLCMVLVPAAWSHAQPAGAEIVYDAQLETVNTNLTAIDNKLGLIQPDIERMKELAEDDTQSMEEIEQGVKDTVERLDSLLERIGDPRSVDISKLDDLLGKVDDAKTGGLQEMPDSVEEPDSDFFNEDGGGIIEPLGTKFEYQPPDGSAKRQENRVPSRYIGESEQLKSIKEYYRVREAAVARRGELLDILKEVMEDMQNNKDDFAHLAKQSALVDIIQGQLKVCGDDINNAYNDVAVKGLHVYTLNAMRSKGDSEFTKLEEQERDAAMEDILDQISGGGPLVPSSGGGGATVTGGFLPW